MIGNETLIVAAHGLGVQLAQSGYFASITIWEISIEENSSYLMETKCGYRQAHLIIARFATGTTLAVARMLPVAASENGVLEPACAKPSNDENAGL